MRELIIDSSRAEDAFVSVSVSMGQWEGHFRFGGWIVITGGTEGLDCEVGEVETLIADSHASASSSSRPRLNMVLLLSYGVSSFLRQPPSVQSRANRVTQYRPDGVTAESLRQ